MSYVIAVDSGGTFTDCVVLTPAGKLVESKVPSTPKDFSVGVLEAVEKAAADLGMEVGDLLRETAFFGHGTTVGTNALITRQGARTGLITTKGHEDAIFIGRVRQKVAGLGASEITDVARLEKADPIVPRSLVKGVTERVDYRGQVVVPLNREEVDRALKELMEAGVESIGVCFLWSFMHPDHERAVKEIARKRCPQVPVTISTELCPVIKDYERTATTVINAYLTKKLSAYLHSLSMKLKAAGFRHSVSVMQSTGGIAPGEEARDRAVALLSSGPVGGVIGARTLGRVLGHKDVITTDVGGTSFDVGLLVDGEPEYSKEPVFAKYDISIPMVNISSIGAGGGSIAWIEPESGLLKVGPHSAGADPGPVCYDKGGEEPTVTDADVVLNRINPDFFLGGAIRLNKEVAQEVIRKRIAEPLKVTVTEAAAGIVNIIDAQMADLVRHETIGRGYNPARFTLYAFGGAGPTHVAAYGRDVGCRSVVIPFNASVFSAFGIASSDAVHISQASERLLAPFPRVRVNQVYQDLEGVVVGALLQQGFRKERISLFRFMDMRFIGQFHEVSVPVSAGRLTDRTLKQLEDDFERVYERKFGAGTSYREAGIEARTYRVLGVGKMPKPALVKLGWGGRSAKRAMKGQRKVYFEEYRGFRLTDIYDAASLRPGNVILGPAIIEAADTTVVVHPKQRLDVDSYRNLILKLR